MDKRNFPKIRVGAGTPRYKIEQLEQLLQQKNRQLAKLKKTRQVLAEREQVVSSCISAQVDLLEVLGRLTFSLPEPDDAAYEAKATAAVEALLKDMEVAQLMQTADSITASMSIEQQQQQQQQGEPWTVMIMRTFLTSPECMATLRRLSTATAADLAATIRKETMELGFAVARYAHPSYMPPAAVAALEDPEQQQLMQRCSEQLHAAINALGRTILLLHVVRDKVLNMSTLNLETLQVEAPPDNFWEVLNISTLNLETLQVEAPPDNFWEDVAAKLDIPPPHMAQLHTGFLIYNAKRSELIHQMQQTMGELQQLLKPLTQQQQELLEQDQQQHLADKQQQVQGALCSGGSNSSSDSHFPLAADNATAAAQQGSQPGSAAAAAAATAAAPDMLECMEDADRLLQQLSRQVWSLREASRCLIFHFANVVDPLQMSLAAVHSWPFIMQPPPIIEVLVKQGVAAQQQDNSDTDDDA
ncbi:hypothetical protein OEZ85_000912 [Tetradesmus obliquus]|uniref:Uncharacterized protein n=1 Tax=Tetradesmus obliquus TaxID=3088 RepID=A0ABY8UK51_TETOB|nr:hypothetical protein OEZ85_000912 [Tetradesmus obliquus]WIA21750.1 hypothetical protein OEZ85_000912 [Tetradesmus obliquus]